MAKVTWVCSELGCRSAIVVCLCLLSGIPAHAQWMGKQTGCYADAIIANPNRPTVANPADITQYGVLELEYGGDHFWPEGGIEQTSFGGLLKFGLLCDVELRWTTTPYLSQTDNSGTHRTVGDNWFGFQARVRKQTAHVPTLSFGYAAKVPTASTEAGLGSGQVDHAFTFLASKDIAKIHFDFNLTHFLIGQGAGNFDSDDQLNLAFSRVISGKWQFTGEFYGDTSLNRSTPGFASSLWALTYSVTPRLVIDGGFEGGLTSGGPHRHVFTGVTYSIANLYPGWRHRGRAADPGARP